MILVDTAVWIDHLNEPELVGPLGDDAAARAAGVAFDEAA